MFDHSCARCGQSALEGRTVAYAPGEGFVCNVCLAADRAPQGEAVRLFTPAPAQLPGQTMMGV